jgi:hexosaminidase
MRHWTISFLIVGIFAGSARAQTPATFTNTLMPEPAQLSVETGRMELTESFTAVTDRFHDVRLDEAMGRYLIRLESQSGLQIATTPARGSAGTLTVTVDGPGETVQSLDENESYSLVVNGNGAHLQAATDVGAMRGLETFLQLVQKDGSRFFVPAMSIQDTPRFRWRGLMIDCSRHFQTVEVIKRSLDGMAAVKLNVFHWHLTDDQGFRIESKVFPKLTGMGSDGLFYTQEQAREIVSYARARGIRVVPEFDMPGHAQSWFVGYPELASGPGPYSIERHFGIFDPVMDPTSKNTYEFIDRFLGEMAGIFPDPYMHVGGDENNGVQWSHNPRIQEFMKAHKLKDTAALQTYFNQQLLPILKKHGKYMVGWDEIFAPGLPKDVVIQSWQGFESLAASAKQGYQGILSAGFYLDFTDEHYLVDPVPANSDLTPAQRVLILGGEACLWGEHNVPSNIDSRLWPRTAAIAERLWSPQSVNNLDDMYRRLRVESLRLEALGLSHLSAEDLGLRQLAGTAAIGPLRTLASVLEPVRWQEQGELQHTTQLTPMDHLVDALPPDPPSRHDMQVLVREYLAKRDAETRARLEEIFAAWIAAGPEAQKMMAASPLMMHEAPRAQQVVELGTMGQQALSYLDKQAAPPPGWTQTKLALIDEDEKPVGLVRFTMLQPLRDLVKAVAN